MPSSSLLQLCADDFGLSEGIDLAILDLIRLGRLSATSCMMAGETLPEHAADLASLAVSADIGLHITLTDLSPLGAMPAFMRDGLPPTLGALIRRAFTGDLDYVEIKAEIGRQIDRFGEIFGRPPDFVDGHQHVHLLPVIRQALFAHIEDGRLPPTTAVRNCAEPGFTILKRGIEVPKALFISALSVGIGKTAGRLGIPTNDSFRGITAFATDRPFGPTFKSFLAGPGHRPLAMCHPGLGGYPTHATDVVSAARPLEYAYLRSEDFVADLTTAGITIGRHPRS